MIKIQLMVLLLLSWISWNTISGQTKHIVNVQNFSFSPQHINISVGDTVRWQWVSGTHTTTSTATSGANSWNAPITSSSTTYEQVITEPGTHTYYCIPHQSMGMTGSITATLVNIEQNPNVVPIQFTLHPNYPNPFNPSTTIRYALPKSGRTTLTIYNSLGQPVVTLIDRYMTVGSYATTFNAGALPTGIYFYRLESAGATASRKMILIK